MDKPEPCPETWALHASAQIAAQAMKLAGICRNDSPAGCASANPWVFAALIQAQPLSRIADALGALERIGNALEARAAEGTQLASEPEAPREPAPRVNPVASWRGWRRDQTSWVNSSRGFVEVPEGGRLAILPTGHKFRVKDFWAVDPGDRWAPIVASVDWSFVEEPASTPTTAPQETPTGDPDTLVLGTSREHHTGGSEALQGEGEAQGASEGAQAGQEGPIAAPGGHPLDQGGWIIDHGGWIRSRLPAEGDGDEGYVKVPTGHNSYLWCSWRIVTPGQPWAPATTEPSPYTPKPLWAHLAYPSSQGWIHDRVPGPEDGDEDGKVVVACQGFWYWDGDPDTTDGPIRASAYAHWSHIVPGQPWRPFT